MIPTQTFENYPTFGDNATKIAPDSAKMSAGFQPADTLPAEWMNWAWNKNSKGIQEHNEGLTSVEAELNNLLSQAGITPAENNNTQLYSAMQKFNASFTSPMQAGGSLTTFTGPAIAAGSIIRIVFTEDLTGTDTTTGLVITYNGSNKAVKVGKDGELVDFVASKIATNTIKYIQANTTIEFVYDGSEFVILGNPVVLSSPEFTIYANGKKHYYFVWSKYKNANNAVISIPNFNPNYVYKIQAQISNTGDGSVYLYYPIQGSYRMVCCANYNNITSYSASVRCSLSINNATGEITITAPQNQLLYFYTVIVETDMVEHTSW